MFDSLDINNDDFLDLEEVEEMMREAQRRKKGACEESVREEALEFMREADKKNDGVIDR